MGRGLDLALLWLYRLAAIAPIRLLAWEPPYTMDAALKRPKKKIVVFLTLNYVLHVSRT